MKIGHLIKRLQDFQKQYGKDTEVGIEVKSSVCPVYDDSYESFVFRVSNISTAYKSWKEVYLTVQSWEDDETWLTRMGERLRIEMEIEQLTSGEEHDDAN